MASLQDQLLKAGIVDQKKAKQIKHDKHKQTKQQPKGKGEEAEASILARQALAGKAERDREINRQKQLEADRRAIRAQIIQLVTSNRIDRERGEVAYQFSDDKKIKKLYVTDKLQNQLVRGMIAIVRLGEGYELVPAAVADKIRQRDDSVIVVHNARVASDAPEDDPYADFQIPDDLMW
jgi:uncharacterized protein YaiL (DUF2058 family)